MFTRCIFSRRESDRYPNGLRQTCLAQLRSNRARFFALAKNSPKIFLGE